MAHTYVLPRIVHFWTAHRHSALLSSVLYNCALLYKSTMHSCSVHCCTDKLKSFNCHWTPFRCSADDMLQDYKSAFLVLHCTQETSGENLWWCFTDITKELKVTVFPKPVDQLNVLQWIVSNKLQKVKIALKEQWTLSVEKLCHFPFHGSMVKQNRRSGILCYF